MSNRDVCKCGGSRKGFCVCSAANDNTDEGVIRLPALSAIATIPAYHRLAISYANLVPLSRRLVVDWLCATIWEYKGIIISGGRAPEYLRYDQELLRVVAAAPGRPPIAIGVAPTPSACAPLAPEDAP